MPYRLAMSPCSDSYGNRTRVTAVKGRCLNRLTKEPYFLVPSKLHTEYADIRFFRSLTSIERSSSSGHLETSFLDVLLVANVSAPNLPVCSIRSSISKLISDRFSRLPASKSAFSAFWSSPRPISNSQLHTLPCFHLCPIYLVVFKGSY